MLLYSIAMWAPDLLLQLPQWDSPNTSSSVPQTTHLDQPVVCTRDNLVTRGVKGDTVHRQIVATAGDVVLQVPCCDAHGEGHPGVGGRLQA